MRAETSDERLLELLQTRGALGILELAAATSVTSTAIRQRLARLMGQGLIERVATPRGRGRPQHRYSLTEKARRQAGSNFADLAIVLWREIRAVKDPEVRRGLLSRIAESLAAAYADRVQGETVGERMDSLSALFAERGIPLERQTSAGLPVLSVHQCPYPDLAEVDQGVCAMEKLMFSRLLQQEVRLAECRLQGHTCCTFEVGSRGKQALAESADFNRAELELSVARRG